MAGLFGAGKMWYAFEGDAKASPVQGEVAFAEQMTEGLAQALRHRGGNFVRPLSLPTAASSPFRGALKRKRRAAQAARPAADIFSYGKTLSPLDNSPFWMYPYIKQDTCISIRTLCLSRCPGSLSEHSICREPSLTQEFSSAVLFSLIRGKIWSY